MNRKHIQVGSLPEIYIQSFIDHMQSHDGYLVNYVHEPEYKRWLVNIRYGPEAGEICEVEILILDQWVSFTSIVMNNLEGKNLAYYHEFLTRFSSQLNGLKLGVTTNGQYITLQTEVPFVGFNYEVLLQVMEGFRSFYAQWIKILLQVAKKWSLKFRKKELKPVDRMLRLFGLHSESNEPEIGAVIPLHKTTPRRPYQINPTMSNQDEKHET